MSHKKMSIYVYYPCRLYNVLCPPEVSRREVEGVGEEVEQLLGGAVVDGGQGLGQLLLVHPGTPSGLQVPEHICKLNFF